MANLNSDYRELETLDLSQTSHIWFEIIVALPTRSLSLVLPEAITKTGMDIISWSIRQDSKLSESHQSPSKNECTEQESACLFL
jgi:hypothetical protein